MVASAKPEKGKLKLRTEGATTENPVHLEEVNHWK